jgi:hypothetical protein
MDLISASSVIGSLATAASVLVAVYAYRRSEDKATFSRFRTSLVDLRNDIRQLDNLLSEASFSEIGTCISEEIRRILPQNPSLETVANFLADTANHNYIVTATHLGLHKAGVIRESEELLTKLNRFAVEHREQMPLIASVLDDCIYYIRQSTRAVMAPGVVSVVLKPEKAAERLVPRLRKLKQPELMWPEIAEAVSAVSTAMLEHAGQKVFNESEGITRIIVDTVSSMSDQQLRRLRIKHQLLMRRRKREPDKKPIERVVSTLNLARDLFTDDEWDSIVERKTKIMELAHSN